MNDFDKHIRNKLEKMEINPSHDVSQYIKANKPKPGLKHFMSRYGGWMAAGIVLVTAVSLLVVNQQKIDEQINQTSEQHRQDIDNVDNDVSRVYTDTDKNNNKAPDAESNYSNQDDGTKKKKENIKITCYNRKVHLKSDEKGTWKSISDVIITQSDQNKCLITCPEYGDYEVLWHNNGDSIVYQVTFCEKPEIFSSKDTIVQSLECRIACNFHKGKWQTPEDIDIFENDDGTINIEAQNFGRYVITRTEVDEGDRFSDSITVHFVAPDKIIRDIKTPRCPGDCAVIVLDENHYPEAPNMLSKEIEPNKYRLKFRKSADKKAICHIINKNDAKQSDSVIFSIPEQTEIEYKLKHENCKQNGSIYLAENPEITKYYLNGRQVDPDENIDVQPGKHVLTWIDKNGCSNKKQIEIESKDILEANFQIELSMDGFSARTENLTHFKNQEYSNNLYYKWYVNDRLQSESKEPELQLDALVNTIELQVSDDEHCHDTFTMPEVRPDKSLIRAPNFFTPNNDGYFDEFKVLIDSRLSGFKAVITSRSGQTVYKWTDPEKGWDGKIHGNENASEGLYFYIIQAYDTTGRPVEKRGTLQLIR